MENIQKTLDNVEKAITTTTAGGIAGLSSNVLVRENLSGLITKLPYRNTNIRDRLTRKPGSGLAASWVVLTGLTSGAAPFAESGTPTENDATYARRAAPYKEYGKKKTISTRMLYAGKSFTDQEAEQTLNAMRETIQDEENSIINGDATGSPLTFDGLISLVTTNVSDDTNNALGFRPDLIDEAAETIWSTYGAMPTAIYCGYGMKRAINQSLIGDVRVNLNEGNSVSQGVDVGFIQTMVGKLPVVPTIAITGDTATYAGNTVEDMYVVTENVNGEDVLYMEDLYPMGKQMLAVTGAATPFMVTEGTVFVCRAEEMQYRIKHVRVK